MASPQTEDGFTRIANELLDAILSFGFTGRQLTIVMAVIRKTYGFNKKQDEIGLSQFRDITGMARQHASKAIIELREMNVLFVGEGRFANLISLNKRYKEWKEQTITKSVTPITKKVIVEPITKSVTGYHHNGSKGITKSGTTIDKPKDNTKRQQEPMPIPEFGGEEMMKAWDDFIEHRKAIKQPLSALSAKKNLAVLRKADAEGYCPVALLNKTMCNNWRGVFAPKQGDVRKAGAKDVKPGFFTQLGMLGGSDEPAPTPIAIGVDR